MVYDGLVPILMTNTTGIFEACRQKLHLFDLSDICWSCIIRVSFGKKCCPQLASDKLFYLYRRVSISDTIKKIHSVACHSDVDLNMPSCIF